MFCIFHSGSLKTKTRKLKLHRHEFDWSHSYLAQAAVISAWCLKEHRPGRWDAEWVDYCLGPIGIAALKLIPQRRESPIFLCRFGSSLCGVFFRVFLEPPDIFVGFPALIMPGYARHGPGITSTKASSRGAFRWFCRIVTCFLSRLGPRGLGISIIRSQDAGARDMDQCEWWMLADSAHICWLCHVLQGCPAGQMPT